MLNRIRFAIEGDRYTESPVRWARFGFISMALARIIRPISPANLIMSLPRSGSSWVGDILGSAKDAIYLREPITQSNRVYRGEKRAVINESLYNKDSYYYGFARDAFSGLPAFRRGIVINPDEWTLKKRCNKRLIIKEVNPLSLKLVLECFRPKLIFLIRHPAAVALSYKKLGWYPPDGIDMIIEPDSISAIDAIRVWRDEYKRTKNYWIYHGGMQGVALNESLKAINDYEDKIILRYEDLCTNPEATFRNLFEFCGLFWDDFVDSYLKERTTKKVNDNPYSTVRNSSKMVDSWKNVIAREDLKSLQEFYMKFNLPWYSTSDEW